MTTTSAPAPKRFGRRYPWADWFGVGQTVVLKRGRDFTTTLNGMMITVRNAARRLGWKVSVAMSLTEDKLIVTTLGRPRAKRRTR